MTRAGSGQPEDALRAFVPLRVEIAGLNVTPGAVMPDEIGMAEHFPTDQIGVESEIELSLYQPRDCDLDGLLFEPAV